MTPKELADAFIAAMPRHAASLMVEHNGHLDYHSTVANELSGGQRIGHPQDFVSPEERERAIATNEMWVATWYPDTPVANCSVAASTLEALLEYLAKEEAG